ncbi:hypothetical protein ACFQ1L_15060 [Phytohabitans flavus]|uniref:hypothetical protein n=1 Tax=Phytohabitans flavus TaxID=1076124 RepID=UPI0036380BE3
MSGPPPDEGALEAGGSWLRRSWSNASPSLRIACVAMWGAGGAATVLGAIGDFAGWWESMPFLTNVASTVTGALFSVPLALVVFQGFAANETQKRDQRGVALLAKATVRDILHDITGLAPDATDLDQLADRLRKLDDELLPAAQDNRSQPPPRRRGRRMARSPRALVAHAGLPGAGPTPAARRGDAVEVHAGACPAAHGAPAARLDLHGGHKGDRAPTHGRFGQLLGPR